MPHAATTVIPISRSLITALTDGHMLVTINGREFSWFTKAFSVERTRLVGYRCLSCGEEFKDTPEHLAAQLSEHSLKLHDDAASTDGDAEA